jgi:DsbC/DsbD-like thiol-disulfide interchange protein
MTATKRLAFFLMLAGALAGVPGAEAARSGWVPADQSRLRLLLAPGSEAQIGAPIQGGIEIVLEPGWYTYWRNSGESGVPPRFDFSGSDNVAAVEVLYPTPQRHEDAGTVSLIYLDSVVFPLRITPRESGRPVTLRLKAAFGVCSFVCIPTAASAEVELPPSAPADPLTAATLRRALPLVPGPTQPGRFAVEQATLSSGDLVIDVRMPDSATMDLFAEPPEGWFIGQPRFASRANGVSRYRLALAGRPAGASMAGQTVRFVAVSGGEAIEETVKIPEPGP